MFYSDPTLNIWIVIAAAAIGSIVGDNAGYWIGKRHAYGLLVRYGKHIGMSVPRIKVGQYLFQKYGGMVNALFDLDVGSPYIYPYIGAGAGYAWISRRLGGAGPFGGLDSEDTHGSFAYQAIAGVSFPIPWVVGLSLTAEYRYYALQGDQTYSVPSPVSPFGRAWASNTRP